MAIAAQNAQLSGGDIGQKILLGNQYASVTVLPATGTTPQTIVTGAPGYVITELGLQIDSNTIIATAGMVSLSFTDTVSGAMAVFRWFLPQTFAAKTAPDTNRLTNGPGFFWNNKTANSVLQVSTDTTLTGGSIRFFCRYAIVNFLN